MRRLMDIIENVVGFLFLIQLLIGAVYALAHPFEFLWHLFMLLGSIVGFFAIFYAPAYIFEELMSDKKSNETKHNVLKGCGWLLLGAVLLAVVSDSTPPDKKYSSTPRSYQTYVREDFNRPTRTYSPPKSDYRPIDQPKQYTPIEVNIVSNSGLRQDIQIDSEAMRKYFDEREQARITREKFLKELMANMEAQRLEREIAHKQRQAEIEAERREQEAARKRLQAEYEANRSITEALMNSNRYLDEPIPYPSNEPVPYYPSEPEPYSPIVQSYKVDGKSLEERLKDIEQEQHRREQIFGKRDSFPNKLFGSHSYSPTLP